MKDWKVRTELQNGFQAEHIRDSELKKLPFLKLRTATEVEDRTQALGSACQAGWEGCCGPSPPHPQLPSS